jgi:mRNA degradation ribonuclease J1/J2
MQNTLDYDFNKASLLIARCELLYENQLKNILVIQQLRTDIENVKKNSSNKLKSVFFDNLHALMSESTDPNSEEETKARINFLKIFKDCLANRIFLASADISSRIIDEIREILKRVRMLLVTIRLNLNSTRLPRQPF